MILTTEQLATLNHVVVDGQVWADNTTKANMLAKVARHKDSYTAAQGAGYKTRAEIDAAAKAIEDAEDAALKASPQYEINRLERQETPRRLAEAVLTPEGKAWLQTNRDAIAVERAKL